MNAARSPLPDIPEHLAGQCPEDAPQDYSLHIPGRIIRIPRLTLAERALLAIVDGLHRNGAGCYAGNHWISLRLGVSTREVSRLIDKMTSEGYITAAHYRDLGRVGGRTRFLAPTAKIPLTAGECPDGLDNLSIPPENDEELSGPSGHSVHTPQTICRDPHDRLSRLSRQAQAQSVPESESKYEVEKEVYMESRQAGTYTPRARAREGDCPTACLPAAERAIEEEKAPAVLVESTSHAPARAPEGGTPHARAHEAPVSEGAALLLRPVADGGAGFDSRERAEEIARKRLPEEWPHWIALAKRRGARSIAGFIIAAIARNDAPPDSYLRAEKAAYMAGGGETAAGLAGMLGRTLPREDVRLAPGAPPGAEDDDEEEEPRRRPAPQEQRPNAACYRILRGLPG